MKLRIGFVSNSSSSSFLILEQNQEKAKEILKECRGSYAMIDDKMVTSFISDCADAYDELCQISEDSYDGSDGSPYAESEFFKVKSVDKLDTIYIHNSLVPENHTARLQSLYEYVADTVVDTDEPEYLKEFYEYCKKIINGGTEIDEDDCVEQTRKSLSYNGEQVMLDFSTYQNNGRLAVILFDEKGNVHSTISTNLVDEDVSDDCCAFVDINNLGDGITNWLENNHLATFTGRIGFSGYCKYPEYRFVVYDGDI